MHLAMAYYPKDSGNAVGAGRHYHQAPVATIPAKHRQAQAQRQHQQRSSVPKSQPFDADDLRRRLYVVLAEQEASQRGKRYARMEEAEAAKTKAKAKTKARAREERNSNDDDDSSSSSSSSSSNNAVDRLIAKVKEEEEKEAEEEEDDEEGESGLLVEVKRASVGSYGGGTNSYKPAEPITTTTTTTTTTTAPYRHVPQVAASQFARTTTAEAVDRRRAHALSYSALDARADGRATAATNKTKTKTKTKTIPKNNGQLQPKRSLMRVPSQRDNSVYYERNNNNSNSSQYLQNSRFVEGCAAAAAAAESNSSSRQQKRHTMVYRKPSFTDLPGSVRRSRSALEDYSTDEDDSGVDFFVPDLATVNEHRVDWTQSDENHHYHQHQHGGNEKRRSSLTAKGGPLLHRVESIWTLKTKLGNLIRHHHKDERPTATIIHEEEVSSSTTRTSSSTTAAGIAPTKSGRRGFYYALLYFTSLLPFMILVMRTFSKTFIGSVMIVSPKRGTSQGKDSFTALKDDKGR